MHTFPFDIGSPHRVALSSAMEQLRECEREMRTLEARKQRLMTEVQALATAEADRCATDSRSREMPYRAAAIETGTALAVSDRSASRLLDQAATLVSSYPDVHDALAAGRIAGGHAQAIVYHGTIIENQAARSGYTTEILAIATGESVGRTWHFAKILAEKFADRDLSARQVDALAKRGTQVFELDDGVAEFRLVADASYVYGIADRLRQQARLVQDAERTACDASDCAGAVRPIAQIRADLATDLLLNGSPMNEHGEVDLSGVQARIQVTVPVLTLLSDEEADESNAGHQAEASGSGETRSGSGSAESGAAGPNASDRRYLRVAGLQGAALLAGYGSIAAHTAHLLAGLATGWDRISCHPVTGQVITVDRYRPSAEITRFVLARDQRCRAPGCAALPHQGDLDHTIAAAQGGETSTRNISALCRRHHVNKHHAGMRMRMLEDGTIEWTTPLGNVIRDHPASRVMFRPRTRGRGEDSVRDPRSTRTSRDASRTSRVRFRPAEPAEPAEPGRTRSAAPAPLHGRDAEPDAFVPF